MKQCNKCNKVKSIEEFLKSKNTKSGYAGHCLECERERTRASYQKNKKRKLAQNKRWSDANKEHHRELQYRWVKENPDKMIAIRKRGSSRKQMRVIEREMADPLYKMTRRIRTLISIQFKSGGWSKTTKTAKLLGCDYETFTNHIKSQFTEGMSWENYGDWHFDHIIPVGSATTKEELEYLSHYQNLQPLWAEDNIRKSDTMPPLYVQYKVHKAIAESKNI